MFLHLFALVLNSSLAGRRKVMTMLKNLFLFMVLAWGTTGLYSAVVPPNQGAGSGKNKTPKAAAQGSSSGSTHVTIAVDRPFTQHMADRAGLDPNNPQLSSNGVQSGEIGSGGTQQKLASSECLLAETLILQANGFKDDSEVDDFCEDAKKADTAEASDSINSRLEEHAGTRIDDALIHLVSWTKGHADGTWYHYSRHADGWSGKIVSFGTKDAVTSLDHLLGHGNVAFLAIHLGIDDSCKISYDIEAKHTQPLNQQDLAELIKLAKDYLTKGKAAASTSANDKTRSSREGELFAFVLKIDPKLDPRIGIWGGQTILKLPSLPASIALTPKTGDAIQSGTKDQSIWNVSTTCSQAPKKNDARVLQENLNSPADAALQHSWKIEPAKLTLPRGSTRPQSVPVDDGAPNFLAGTALPNVQAAGDGKAGSGKPDPLKDMGMTVPNEGTYHWDVSVAMPVNSYKNLKFDSANNLITLKKTDDIKPYAVFNFYPLRADLRAKNGISVPGFAAGIPMGSKPLQRSFVGGGFVLAIQSFRVQPLVGVRIEKDTIPSTLTSGSSANSAQLTNDLHSAWHAKLQVMIAFSIGDARKVLGLK
jgi:hypothetical protein